MSKPGYIKVKKIWEKEFSQKEISDIWDMFLSVTEKVLNRTIDWSTESYTDIVLGNPNQTLLPPHPESDKYDDTEGVSPKQMKRLLKKMSLKQIENLFVLFGKKSQLISTMRDPDGDLYYDNEDRNISWKYFLKEEILKGDLTVNLGKFFGNDLGIPKDSFASKNIAELILEIFEKEEKEISQIKAVLAYVFSGRYPYKISEEVLLKILKEEILLSDFQALLEAKILDSGTVITSKNCNLDTFFKERESEWKKIWNFVPKDKNVLLLDPTKWSQDHFLGSMQKMFGHKQIAKLSEEQKIVFLDFYKKFGNYLFYLVPIIKHDKMKSIPTTWKINLIDETSEVSKLFLRILEDSKKGIDTMIKISSFYKIIIAVSSIKSIEAELSKKSRFSTVDIESLVEAGNFVLTSNDKKIFEKISFRDLFWIKKANITGDQLNRLLDLYRKTKDLKVKYIPILSGEVDGYEYEMLTKESIAGLVVGNLTQCCQRIGGIGNDCVYYGAQNENSTFFVVKKNGNVVAQSWVWTNKSGTQLTFDSIECVSNAYGQGVMQAYHEYAIRALNESKKIEQITVGAYGRTGLYNQLERATDYDTLQGVYNDSGTQYLIAKK